VGTYADLMGLAEAAFVVKSRTVRRASGRYLEELIGNERLPRAQLEQMQNARAAAVARFAAVQTPYYRRLFDDHGLDASQMHRLEQWQRIPLLDRTIVKEHAEEFVSTESTPKTAREAKTGGSTGQPLRTQQDNRVPNLALAWRMYRWWGVQPWENIARIGRWGFGVTDAVKNAVSWWPSTQIYMDARLFDAKAMHAFHGRIVRTRPVLIEGYVGAMLAFAEYLDAENLRIPMPRAIATTAAPLTGNVRARLEGVYQTPVYDEYRGSEINWLAGECARRHGLHMFSDARRIEVVDELGEAVPAGTVGDIVVTDLTNRVFPLIRYRPGDRGMLLDGECTCGVTLPMIAQPEGRTTDVLRLPSGNAINHGLMAMFSSHPESVRLFQILQKADHSITIRVILGDERDARRHVENAAQQLRQRIRNEVPVSVLYVDELPYTGGKTKYLISEVPSS